MIVYHGSSIEVKNPDITYSKAFLDFGRGFYVTTFQKQAEQWALRKAIRQGKDPIVNVYTLQDDFKTYRVLSFDKENEKWLDFVCECRKGNELNQVYDIIIGNVADDNVFKTVDKKVLTEEYKQNLEESMIAYLSEIKNLELRISMDIYYRSKLAQQIADGLYGIENLDYKYLVQDLIENEPELFE